MDFQILSVLVSNHFGVLTRVTNLFSRRGFNIKQLTVGETDDPEISRITILTQGNKATLEQIQKQLAKLEDVKKVMVLPLNGHLSRELLLIKVRETEVLREALEAEIASCGGKILDSREGSLFIEITGDTDCIDQFIERMKQYGILEVCRTGVTALETGQKTIYNH